VRLALEAGCVVRATGSSTTCGRATRQHPPNTLQSKVARLRRALGDPRRSRAATAATARRRAGAVDALAVSRRRHAAQRLDAGEARAAAALCADALARFRGELLPAAGDWAQPHRGRLEEARAQLVETRLSARVRLGEGDVIGEPERPSPPTRTARGCGSC
jgi:hypothetical protein